MTGLYIAFGVLVAVLVLFGCAWLDDYLFGDDFYRTRRRK